MPWKYWLSMPFPVAWAMTCGHIRICKWPTLFKPCLMSHSGPVGVLSRWCIQQWVDLTWTWWNFIDLTLHFMSLIQTSVLHWQMLGGCCCCCCCCCNFKTLNTSNHNCCNWMRHASLTCTKTRSHMGQWWSSSCNVWPWTQLPLLHIQFSSGLSKVTGLQRKESLREKVVLRWDLEFEGLSHLWRVCISVILWNVPFRITLKTIYIDICNPKSNGLKCCCMPGHVIWRLDLSSGFWCFHVPSILHLPNCNPNPRKWLHPSSMSTQRYRKTICSWRGLLQIYSLNALRTRRSTKILHC